MDNLERIRSPEEIVEILKAAIYISTNINCEEKIEGIVTTLGQYGANTRFERAVLATLEFFRSHHFRIAGDPVVLTMAAPNSEPQIPESWRNSIVSLNPNVDVATFYVQSREQVFELVISRINRAVNVNLMHVASGRSKQLPQAMLEELFDEFMHPDRRYVFANYFYDVLKTAFKSPIEKALRNESPAVSRSSYPLAL